MLQALLVSMVLGVVAGPDDKEPPVVKVDDVGKYVGKTVTVEYVVKSINQSPRAFALLNSKEKFNDKGNFSGVILKEDRDPSFDEAMLDSADKVIERFLNKRVRLSGKIEQKGERYEMVLEKWQNCFVVDENAQ